ISAGVYGAWQSQSFPASSKTMVVTGVKPGARYQVRLRYITAKGVENPGGNTGLGEVTVGAVNAGTVAGKPAQEVVDDLNLNAEQIAAEILRGALARAYIDALTHLAGVPIGTVLLQEKEQRIDADGAFAALMSLLGAKNGAGTAFILNAASVQVTPTQSLATFLSFIDSTLGDGTVTITELREALNGERGRVALSINNNGHLTGWEIASEGGTGGPITGTLGIVTDQLYMVDPADATGETSTTFLEYVGGQLKVKNLLVEGDLVVEGSLTTPKYAPNSINVPVISTGSAVISCDGTNKLIISHTVDLAYDAAVFVTCFLSSHFPGGDKNWAATLYIDGVSVFDCGGANGEATITMGGSMYCAAGARLVEVRLNSHASVNVTSRTLNTLGPMR
uniref:hypothetical protein n=1 Tax=Caulobacter sp. DWP3-1-3b2 TaxID=2804643 RepID=UPI003CE7D9BE